MKEIKIAEDLQNKIPQFRIGVLSFKASIYEDETLTYLIQEIQKSIENRYQLSDVLTVSNIKEARDGYKTLGKDPSRYRLAVESLYRRIVKGKELYRINNVVDIGNVLSLKTRKSIAVLDEEQIKGDVIIRIGKDEPYEGIGRGTLNIENIPVYCDEIGPFGSPTSDTERTMITNKTKNILLFIISFNGEEEMQDDIEYAMTLYKKYAKADCFTYKVI